jgi:signal-transduction protein with cAMP-binding, CBS, and nucleotidyltransferase domain
MLQNSSASLISCELLENILGQHLSEQEISRLRQQIKVLEPPPRKQFWQATDAEPGVYIIAAGRVRLIDRNNNLLTSLEAGKSFGELTLFPEESFAPYSIRATQNSPTICYLPSKLLQDLSHRYPAIQKHLHHQAVLRDELKVEGSKELKS